MSVQTSVSSEPTARLSGQLMRGYKDPVVLSGVCDEALGIPFGRLVVRDGSDTKWDLPASAAEVRDGMAGILVRDGVNEYVSASVSVENGDTIGVMVEGICAVYVEETVARGDAVYCRHTSDGGSNTALGTFRNDVDSNRAERVPGARFLTATSGAGIALVVVNIGSPVYQYEAVTAVIADISTASSAFVAAPIAGTVVAVYGVLGAAISGADSAITTEINGTLITNGGFTVAQSGSAAGDRDSATPTAANTVAVGDALEAITDGASTGTATESVTFVIRGIAV